jgi:hypothetical protein
MAYICHRNYRRQSICYTFSSCLKWSRWTHLGAVKCGLIHYFLMYLTILYKYISFLKVQENHYANIFFSDVSLLTVHMGAIINSVRGAARSLRLSGRADKNL